jgi:Mg2+ and Co2+ transporter CorA
LFGKNFEPVSQKILHKYYHLTTLVDSAREIILELRETYDALLANRTNDAMKTLTLMSFMTFPLALLVAVATFPGAPKSWHTEQGFYILISIIVIIGITMITFFKRKDWL